MRDANPSIATPAADERARRCAPSEADWYAHAVIGRNIPGGTQTNEVDDYFAGPRPRRSDLLHLERGWKMLTFTSTRIVR